MRCAHQSATARELRKTGGLTWWRYCTRALQRVWEWLHTAQPSTHYSHVVATLLLAGCRALSISHGALAYPLVYDTIAWLLACRVTAGRQLL